VGNARGGPEENLVQFKEDLVVRPSVEQENHPPDDGKRIQECPLVGGCIPRNDDVVVLDVVEDERIGFGCIAGGELFHPAGLVRNLDFLPLILEKKFPDGGRMFLGNGFARAYKERSNEQEKGDTPTKVETIHENTAPSSQGLAVSCWHNVSTRVPPRRDKAHFVPETIAKKGEDFKWLFLHRVLSIFKRGPLAQLVRAADS